MITELIFEKNTAYLSGISNVSNISIVPNSSIQVKGTSTVSLVGKLSMLETGGSSTLFLYEN
jgi:hypothetical protein